MSERTVAAGERIELDLDAYWSLAEGELLVVRDGRVIELWRAPRPLDWLGTHAQARSAHFVAATEARLIGRPRQTVDAAALAAGLAEESAALWRRVGEDARRDDDRFASFAEPLPGPWHFDDVRATVLLVEGDVERLRRCLPAGLRPLPGAGGHYLLIVAELGSVQGDGSARRAFYREVTPLVPAWSLLHGPGAFVPELYPDAWMAMVLGREIYGFPKRSARIGMDAAGAELLLEGRLALRLRWQLGEDAPIESLVQEIAERLIGHAGLAQLAGRFAAGRNARAQGFVLPLFVHKRIGAAHSAGATRELDELVRVPFSFDPARSVRRLELQGCDLGGGPGIIHGKARAAWQLATGFRFGEGRIVRRYRGRS
jgi:hypothetical protein